MRRGIGRNADRGPSVGSGERGWRAIERSSDAAPSLPPSLLFSWVSLPSERVVDGPRGHVVKGWVDAWEAERVVDGPRGQLVKGGVDAWEDGRGEVGVAVCHDVKGGVET